VSFLSFEQRCKHVLFVQFSSFILNTRLTTFMLQFGVTAVALLHSLLCLTSLYAQV